MAMWWSSKSLGSIEDSGSTSERVAAVELSSWLLTGGKFAARLHRTTEAETGLIR